MTRILVVGATSPLGIHLADLLVDRDYRVQATYRSDKLVPPSWWKSGSISCMRFDLERVEDLASIRGGFDIGIWLAHREQGHQNEQEIELNTSPFEWVCSKAAELGINKLVFISSGGSVYGEPIRQPIPEDHPRRPLSSYGKAKKRMEDILLSYGNSAGLSTAILRPGNIYGPESVTGRAKGIVGAYIRSLCSGRPFTLRGDGSAVRDYVHVDDVARGICCAIECGQGQIVWNVGTGTGRRVKDLMHLISDSIPDKRMAVIHDAAYDTDVTSNVLSIERIGNECGWVPEIPLEEGIRELVQLCVRAT